MTHVRIADKWDRHFIDMALTCARMSKDPRTCVGAVIIRPDRGVVSTGFNGFPRGIYDMPDRLNHKPTKLDYIVHGEMNAILSAGRSGVPLVGCTLYLACTSGDGEPRDEIWGGAPCTNCTKHLIQTGIAGVVSLRPKINSSWAENLKLAQSMLSEADISYVELEL